MRILRLLRQWWRTTAGLLITVAGIALASSRDLASALHAPVWVTAVLICVGLGLAVWAPISDHLAARAEKTRQLGAAVRGGWPPPRLSAVDPYELGVTASTLAQHDRADSEALSRPPYIPRRIDDALRGALRETNFVLVTGPSKAGKSRTALEIASDVYPDAFVLAPTSTNALSWLLNQELELQGRSLLWLDDLHDYLTTGAVDALSAHLFLDRENPAVIVATMRLLERERLLSASGGAARDAQEFLSRANEIELDYELDDDERAQAQRLYPNADFSDGIGRYFTAVDELIARYRAQEDTSLESALVKAAVDWRRAGMTRPVRRDELRRLTPTYLSEGLVTEDGLDTGLHWATAPVSSSVRLLATRYDRGGSIEGFLPAEPIVEYDEGVRGIERAAWDTILEIATPDEAADVVLPARARGHSDVSEAALIKSLEARDEGRQLQALSRLASDRHEAGDLDEAERLYREPVERGYVPAKVNLGLLLMARGKRSAGLQLLREAAEAGDPLGLGAFNFGLAMEDQGELDEAKEWYRRSIENGDFWNAKVHLAELVSDSDPEEAERLLREALEFTKNDSEWASMSFLQGRAEAGAMEGRVRRIPRADAVVALHLAMHLRDRGQAEESRELIEYAAGAGDATAATELGDLLWESGDEARAEQLFRESADAGNGVGAARLVDLLLRQRRDGDARPFIRQILESGDSSSLYELGRVFLHRGEIDRATGPWQRGAEKGDAACAFNFARQLQELGNYQEAEHWYRVAIDALNPALGAMHNLATVLWAMERYAEFREWIEKAAEIEGSVLSRSIYGLVLYGEGKVEAAEAELRAARDAGSQSDIDIYDTLFDATQRPKPDGEARLQARAELGDPDSATDLGFIASGRANYMTARYWIARGRGIDQPFGL